jgi:small subunit ribosomal protein S18
VKKERQIRSRRPCKFCKEHIDYVDYKDDKHLRRFMTERGKITPRRITGTCARHQRILAAAIKRARIIALVPFVREYYR